MVWVQHNGWYIPTSLLPAAQEPVHLRFMCGAVMMQRFRVGGLKIIRYVIKYTGSPFSLEGTTLWQIKGKRNSKKMLVIHISFHLFSRPFLNGATYSGTSVERFGDDQGGLDGRCNSGARKQLGGIGS